MLLAALVLPVLVYLVLEQGDQTETGGITWVRCKSAGVSFSKSEVTLGQYRACVRAGACSRGTYETKADVKACNWGHPGRERHPMNCVSWHGAVAFCRWVKGRLPSKKEWQAEASNGGTRAYPWGSQQADCTRSVMHLGGPDGAGCKKDHTWPVCSKPAGNSVSGLCDMSGNVWEWTSTVEGAARVLRGGGWDICTQDYLDSEARVKFSPSFKFVNLGFRCVRSNN